MHSVSDPGVPESSMHSMDNREARHVLPVASGPVVSSNSSSNRHIPVINLNISAGSSPKRQEWFAAHLAEEPSCLLNMLIVKHMDQVTERALYHTLPHMSLAYMPHVAHFTKCLCWSNRKASRQKRFDCNADVNRWIASLGFFLLISSDFGIGVVK